MKIKLLAAALLAACGLAWAPLAHADLISIGLQQAGVGSPLGSITTVGTGSGAAVAGPISYGSFNINIITAADTVGSALPELLNSTSLNVSSSTAGTITIWITAQGLTQPTGFASVVSSFTSNTLPTGWSVTESTYYDAANGLYSTATPLSSQMFTAIGTDVLTSAPINFASPFSITERYVLTSNGTVSTALSTINTSVPEPGSLALLGTALLGLGLIGWSFRRRDA